MSNDETDPIVRAWCERLERAQALFEQGNLTGAAKVAGEVEREAETRHRRSAVGSEQRRDSMRVLEQARGALERFELTAGIGDDDDEED